jgi:hypothetical protein
MKTKMKLLTLIFFTFPVLGFAQEAIDTIFRYEHPPIDLSTIVAPEGTIIAYADSAFQYPSNISYYVKFFDIDSNIVFEALRYNHYWIGKYIDYHKNGNIKTKGNYTAFIYRKNGKIKKYPRKTGKWTYFSKSGKFIRTENLKSKQ